MTPKNRDELALYVGQIAARATAYSRPLPRKVYIQIGLSVLEGMESTGLAIVPVEPTEEMLSQVTEYHSLGEDGQGIDPVFWLEPEDWRAMLAASPFAKEG